jgi:hypothetical protein
VTGHKVDRLAAERAVAAWRSKSAEAARPTGFSDEEAAVIVGVDEATMEEVHRCWTWPSLEHSYELNNEVWYEYRWSVADLTRAAFAVELRERGLHPLTLALACKELDLDLTEDRIVRVRAERRGWETVYPLDVKLAEQWLLEDGSVSRHLWSAAQLVDVADRDHAATLLAESAETQACIDRGEALLFCGWDAADRVLRRVDGWWTEHVSPRATRMGG